MTGDVRTWIAAAERAEQAGDDAGAYERFVSAGDVAAGGAAWKVALRCFLRAIRIDPFQLEAVQRGAAIASQVHGRLEWSEYASALERGLVPRFAHRAVQLVVGNDGAFIAAPDVGTVLDVLMTGDDLVEVHPAGKLGDMPLAMALIILRRAMTGRLRVVYRGRPQVVLHDSGEWEPV